MSYTDRVVVLVDMDCFYCQVEENLDESIRGKPIAVVQYNAWRGGGIIAVNYPARDKGVTRHMRGDEAQKICPEIELVRVPNVRGKADLTKYREAGKRVASVLQTFTSLLERASVDEAYLDITDAVKLRLQDNSRIKDCDLQTTHVVGYPEPINFLESIYDSDLPTESNLKLAIGGAIAEEIRAEVFQKTGYKCSAGIAHNKILAKLVCGLHKPNQQTILPHNSVPILYEGMPIRKLRSLGGKFGQQISETIGIEKMNELYKFSVRELASHFDEKTANWLYNIARGIDLEPVTIRLVSKSIGCCKKFPGRSALTTTESVEHWLKELAIEISERLEKDMEENNRKAKQMVINFAQPVNKKDVSSSRTHVLNSYESSRIMSDAYEVIKRFCMRPDGSFCIKFLGISAGKFEDLSKNVNDITSFFKRREDVNTNDKSREVNTQIKSLFKKGDSNVASMSEDVDTVHECQSEGITSYFKRINHTDIANTSKSEMVTPLFKRKLDMNSANKCKTEDVTSFLKIRHNENNSNDSSEPVFDKKNANVLNVCESQEINTRVCKDMNKNVTEIINMSEDSKSNSLSVPKDSSKISFFKKFFDTDSTVTDQDSLYKSKLLVTKVPQDSQIMYSLQGQIIDSFPESTQIRDIMQEDTLKTYAIQVETQDTPTLESIHLKTKYMAKLNSMQIKTNDTANLNLMQVKTQDTAKLDSMQVETKDSAELDSMEVETQDTSKLDSLEEDSQMELNQISHSTIDSLNMNGVINNVFTEDIDGKSLHDINSMYHLNSSNRQSYFESSSSTTTPDNYQICPECDKKVEIQDFISHMDYHVALKIVRDEADLYRPVRNNVEAKQKSPNKNAKRKNSNSTAKNKPGSTKRKIAGGNNCTKLTNFLITSKDDNVAMETCQECNRKVPLDEFPDHIDYHVAKKLHLELNPRFSPHKTDDKMVKRGDKKIKSDKNNKGDTSNVRHIGNSITAFFKPL